MLHLSLPQKYLSSARTKSRLWRGQVLGQIFGVISLITLGSLSHNAQANDASFGGLGADLTPQVQSDIMMQSEVIKAVQSKSFTWRIDAKYVFHNPTDKVISVDMGFPERLCDPDIDCGSPSGDRTTFRGIVTEVRGKLVKTTIQSVSKKSGWGSELGRVHLFKVTFKPKETLTITHRYEMGISTSTEGEVNFDYVTKTGSLWGAPIGTATFVIRLNRRPNGFVFPKEYQLVGYELVEGMTEVTFRQTQWKPSADLLVAFNYDAVSIFKCPAIREVISEISGPITREKVLPLAKLVSDLSSEQLRVCRNLPYATHGYRFKSQKLRGTFYRYAQPVPLSTLKKDYVAFTGPSPEEATDFLAVIFRLSEHYTPQLLSKDELRWVRIFKHLEKIRKGQ